MSPETIHNIYKHKHIVASRLIIIIIVLGTINIWPFWNINKPNPIRHGNMEVGGKLQTAVVDQQPT